MTVVSRWARTVDPAVRDWWPVALVLLLVQIGPEMESGRRVATIPATLFGLAHAVPLRWRREQPLPILAVIMLAVAGQALLTALPLQFGSFIAIMVAAFSAGSFSTWKPAVAGLAGTLALVAAIGLSQQPTAPVELLFPVVYIGGSWALGRAARRRRAMTERLAALTLELQAERDERIRLALLAERAHVAREVHDIVAHSLGVVVLQAEAAAAVLPGDSPAARPIEVIQATGREALDEVRRLLLLLREGGSGRAPQPRLAGLGELAEQFSLGGLAVEMTLDVARALPGDVELSVYRIVQEALTNALKHGRATRAAVTVALGEQAVTVAVVDNGTASSAADSGGFGVAGMRERAALLGGELVARRQEGGGFRVEARLPLAAS